MYTHVLVLEDSILIAGAGRVSWIEKKKKRVFPGRARMQLLVWIRHGLELPPPIFIVLFRRRQQRC
jgi:hypothetical protein